MEFIDKLTQALQAKQNEMRALQASIEPQLEKLRAEAEKIHDELDLALTESIEQAGEAMFFDTAIMKKLQFVLWNSGRGYHLASDALKNIFSGFNLKFMTVNSWTNRYDDNGYYAAAKIVNLHSPYAADERAQVTLESVKPMVEFITKYKATFDEAYGSLIEETQHSDAPFEFYVDCYNDSINGSVKLFMNEHGKWEFSVSYASAWLLQEFNDGYELDAALVRVLTFHREREDMDW